MRNPNRIMRSRSLLVALVVLSGLMIRSEGWANSLPETIDQLQPRVVKIFGAGGLRNLANYGTGVIVSPDGHIATVWNHLLDSDVVSVVLHDGRRYFGRVIGTNSKFDVAVLKIDATELPYLNLDDLAQVGPGAGVLAFSNVFKVATGDEPVSVLQGVVSARTQLSAWRGRFKVPYDGEVYLIDAVTNNPGAAGGLLTTSDGRPLAMLGRELKGNNNTWLNYAIPFSVLREPIRDIISGKQTTRSSLLAGDSAARPREQQFTGLDFGFVLVPDVVARTPAYIDTILPESEAAKQQLKPDDLIVFANGELVSSIRTLNEVLRQLVSGDDLRLIIRRGEDLLPFTFIVPQRDSP